MSLLERILGGSGLPRSWKLGMVRRSVESLGEEMGVVSSWTRRDRSDRAEHRGNNAPVRLAEAQLAVEI